jgi:hypothetical protein
MEEKKFGEIEVEAEGKSQSQQLSAATSLSQTQSYPAGGAVVSQPGSAQEGADRSPAAADSRVRFGRQGTVQAQIAAGQSSSNHRPREVHKIDKHS